MIYVNMPISIQDWLRNHIYNSLSSQDPKPASQWIDGDVLQRGVGVGYSAECHNLLFSFLRITEALFDC